MKHAGEVPRLRFLGLAALIRLAAPPAGAAQPPAPDKAFIQDYSTICHSGANKKGQLDLARLAFETDSTRAITLMLNSVVTPVLQIPGASITDSYHNLSHHGMAEEKLAQLRVIDEGRMRPLAGLLQGLKNVREGGGRLLDRTMVLYGSNLGDANARSTPNLPTRSKRESRCRVTPTGALSSPWRASRPGVRRWGG